jgi:hypothetical protein
VHRFRRSASIVHGGSEYGRQDDFNFCQRALDAVSINKLV